MATREENFVDEGELLQAEDLEDKLALILYQTLNHHLEQGGTASGRRIILSRMSAALNAQDMALCVLRQTGERLWCCFGEKSEAWWEECLNGPAGRVFLKDARKHSLLELDCHERSDRAKILKSAGIQNLIWLQCDLDGDHVFLIVPDPRIRNPWSAQNRRLIFSLMVLLGKSVLASHGASKDVGDYERMMEWLVNGITECAFVLERNDVVLANERALQYVHCFQPSIGDDPWRHFYEKIQKLSEAREGMVFEQVLAFADECRCIKTYLMPLAAEGRNWTLVIAVDITDRWETARTNGILEEKVEENRALFKYLSNVSHELRTPLNSILGTIQVLEILVRSGRPLDLENKLEAMRLNCYRLLRQANMLIDFSKINAGYMTLCPCNCDLVSVVAGICNTVVPYITQRGLSFQFVSSEDRCVAAVDIHKLEHIMLNLLSNAVKFSRPGGVIVVGVASLADTVEITVSDQGAGVPDSIRDKVFDLYCVGDPRKVRGSGSGIGLAMVKSFVDLHGGKVSFESEENEGTTFTIELPRRVVDDQKVVDYKYFKDHMMVNTEFSSSLS
ncbi:sensor histidine kinase [Gehongia tenuis]|uniref:histidine kinase n=1 Tax=Gehongia tenuis TaxID=2763655 RepID=A0A926D7B5_9FIRM|nr:HAMP domain-containing sensor histidine kinase [Gehongia tenuis]MBC8531690.1 HAMP domain-containing histidine kinase [Gehongia tenuis]